MDPTRSAGRILACLMHLTLLTGCRTYPQSRSAPDPPPSQWVERAVERWPDTSYAELSLGRETFIKGCNRCHGLPDVTYLPEDEWPTTLLRMGRYAKLDETQGRAVLRFVLTARAEVFGQRSAFDEADRADSGPATPVVAQAGPTEAETPAPGPSPPAPPP